MRQIICAGILPILFIEVALSQSSGHFDGGDFLKMVEYNVAVRGAGKDIARYNLSGKSVLDRIFFGETNSPVEFVYRPPFEDACALRIIKSPSRDVYMLEVMRLANSEEVINLVSRNTRKVVLPDKLQAMGLISLEEMKLVAEHNEKTERDDYTGEIYRPYRPESKSFRISDELADKLQAATVSLIGDFKAEGVPPVIADGETVTFRCIAGDELWTLEVHVPQQRALRLSDLFRQIIADSGKVKKLDEGKYLKMLGETGL